MNTAWIAGAIALSLAARAEAGPLADALARHGPADVEALRARLPGDPSIRCTLGAVYARRGDLPRAMLYLVGCDEVALPDDVAREIVRTARQVKKAVRASELTELTIVTAPAGLRAELAALAGEPLVTPATVWVPAGAHTVRATHGGQTLQRTITTRPYSRATLLLEVPTTSPAPPRHGRVDFEDEHAGDAQAGPPPDVKRPSLLSDRYRGVTGPRSGPVLDDPLPLRAGRAARPWFGLRLGGGVFDEAARAAVVRPAVALAARFPVAPRLFVAARLDWSRRGGAAPTSIDAAGASVGAGWTLLDHRGLALAAIGQLRGDLRFADTRDAMAVARAGASAAATLELAIARTPLTVGLRFEQALTTLVEVRDRALLVELGVDWR